MGSLSRPRRECRYRERVSNLSSYLARVSGGRSASARARPGPLLSAGESIFHA